jgi:hypothetical protein
MVTMDTPLLKKIDPRYRHRLPPTGAIEILIRTEGPVSPEQKKCLIEAGFAAHAVTGRILEGAVTDRFQLESVARLPFVSEIEISRPMMADRSPGQGSEIW